MLENAAEAIASLWNALSTWLPALGDAMTSADGILGGLAALAAVVLASLVVNQRQADAAQPDTFTDQQVASLQLDKVQPRGLWRLFARDMGWLLLLSTAINVTMFAAPLHMLLVYDRVLNTGSVETLIMLTVICVALILAMSLLTAARQWLLIGKAEELDRELGKALFHHEGSTASQERSDKDPATLADLATVRQLVTSPAASAILDLPFAPIFFIGLFAVHSYFGVLALAGAVLIVIVAVAGDLFASGGLRRAGEASALARNLAAGMHANGTAVRAMGIGERIGLMWSSLYYSANAAHSGAGAHSAVVSSVVKFLRMALQSITLALGAWLVLQKEASSGAIIASSIVMGRALGPLEILIGSWKSLLPSLHACRRLTRTGGALVAALDEETQRTRLPVPRGELRARIAKHNRPGSSQPMLFDIALGVVPGECLAIVGQGGAGKSTLARLLLGLQRPDEGSVTLDGVELSNWPRAHIGPHLGYVAQEADLIEGTVGDNISRLNLSVAGNARELINRAIVEAAMHSGSHEVFARLPKAYDTPIGPGGRMLSSSERKRVALARAVYGNVRLVVLDDPTSGLDAAGERAIGGMLAYLKEKRVSVVLITNNARLLQQTDKIVVLDEGRIAREGTARDVFNVHAAQPAAASSSSPQPSPSRDPLPPGFGIGNAAAAGGESIKVVKLQRRAEVNEVHSPSTAHPVSNPGHSPERPAVAIRTAAAVASRSARPPWIGEAVQDRSTDRFKTRLEALKNGKPTAHLSMEKAP